MARRKWTLVVILVCMCAFVCPRPQDSSTTASSILSTEKVTDTPSRYKNGYISYNVDLSKLNVKNNVNVIKSNVTKIIGSILKSPSNYSEHYNKRLADNILVSNLSRIVRQSKHIRTNKRKTRPDENHKKYVDRDSNFSDLKNTPNRKTNIRKVITKWKDRVDVNDFDFKHDSSTSIENPKDTIEIYSSTEIYSTENSNLDFSTENKFTLLDLKNKIYAGSNNKLYGPYHQYSNPIHVQSSNYHITDNLSTVRPIYSYNTPTLSPIVTNIGNPQSWTHQQYSQNIHKKPATPKPTHYHNAVNSNYYNNHNNVHNYPQQNRPDHNIFEVSTFQPVSAYTDRIVIRPEEYSASSDDCPTIYLTLNNTFQGQGKEACPDLNIAVNTNVVNKNVVVETEEDEGDEDGDNSFFPGGFGLPLGEDSASEEAPVNELFESGSNEESESVSEESNALTNYNAAPAGELNSQSIAGAPSSPISALGTPNRPQGSDKNDDDFFTALSQFLSPAFRLIGWFATVNPFNFGLFSLLMTPVALALAGTSGVTALFAPWALSYGREAPKIVHVYRPHWRWDDENKTWHLHSFPNNRMWHYQRHNEGTGESIIKRWTNNLKQFVRNIIINLHSKRDKINNRNNRKKKRKRRDIWASRIK